MLGNVSDSRGGFDGKVGHPSKNGMLTCKTRIKTISLNVIAKFKAENPDFDFDFEAFVKELSTDETV